MTHIALIAAVCFIGASATRSFGQERFNEGLEVLGSMSNLQWTIPTAINDHGTLVGYAGHTGTAYGYRAFLWTRATGFRVIAEDVIARDINNRGDVVGSGVCLDDPSSSTACG